MTEKKNTKMIMIVVIIAIIAVVAIFFYSSQNKKSISNAVVNQLELVQTNEDEQQENEDTGIILEGGSFLNDFENVYGTKVKIEVIGEKDGQATLSIEAPDLYSILKQSGDEQVILDMLKQENCPMTTNEVIVNYTKENGTYQIEETEELINAVYGNASYYFEEMRS